MPVDLKRAVAEAEAAVSAVKDPNLKVAAFEKVLQHLLSPCPKHSDKAHAPAEKLRRSAGVGKSEPMRAGPQKRVEELIREGFFRKPRTIAEVKVELGNRGYHIPRTSLSGPLQILCQKKLLRRQKGIARDKAAYGYSNW